MHPGRHYVFSCGAAEHEEKKTKRLLSNPRIPVCTLVGLALKLSQQLVLWRIASGRNVVDYVTADCIYFLLGICLCMRDVGCDFEHQHSARATRHSHRTAASDDKLLSWKSHPQKLISQESTANEILRRKLTAR